MKCQSLSIVSGTAPYGSYIITDGDAVGNTECVIYGCVIEKVSHMDPTKLVMILMKEFLFVGREALQMRMMCWLKK